MDFYGNEKEISYKTWEKIVKKTFEVISGYKFNEYDLPVSKNFLKEEYENGESPKKVAKYLADLQD